MASASQSGSATSSGHGGPIKASTTNFPFCPDVAKYDKLAKVGQGTFGLVDDESVRVG